VAGGAASEPPSTTSLVDAFASALADGHKLRKQRAVLDLLDKLTPENAPAVRDVFVAAHRPGDKEDFAWIAFWTRWGEVDGGSALQYFATHPELAGSAAGTHAMAGFIGLDRTAARHWLADHRDLDGFEVLARVYAENLAKTDVAMATEELFSITSDPAQRYIGLGPIVLEALTSGGMQGVEGWFANLNDMQKKEAFIHTVWAIKDVDLDALTRWYSAQADKPWRDDKHLDEIVRRYAPRDAAASIDWLLSLPPNRQTGLPAGLPLAVDIWARSDASNAAAWLVQNVDQPWFANAASGYLRSRRGSAAEAELLGAIDPDRRQAVLDELRK
jgi:hypothetical protein